MIPVNIDNMNKEQMKWIKIFGVTVGAAAVMVGFDQGTDAAIGQLIAWPVFALIASAVGLLFTDFKTSFAKVAKVMSFIIWVIAGLGFVFGFIGALNAMA